MKLWMIFMILIIWHVVFMIPAMIWSASVPARDVELCNPYKVYTIYYKNVNWFGAIMISLLYTLLCPIGAICYWFYKLCTIGRR